MIEFDNSFFEDEVKEGFYVPAMVKKAWAAEFRMLEKIKRVIDAFSAYKEDMAFIWKSDSMTEAVGQIIEARLYEGYVRLTERFTSCGLGLHT